MIKSDPTPLDNLDEQAIVAARILAVDAIESAQSGHPGASLSLAPVAHLLFQKHIRHDPSDPDWVGRDRFILSCGHASMLLYTQLYLTGYDVTIDDLKAFRQLHSRTPGHPELGFTPGVDATTGPLGQGFAMGVGMAMAMKHQQALYDPENSSSVFDRRVWVLASDGDLQEGISYEAGALAGRQQLDNLTVIYDDNDIQIEGSTSLTWNEDTRSRFEAQGWRVSTVPMHANGDVDLELLDHTLTEKPIGKPHLVILNSEIAFPSPTARGTAASHGAPLGEREVTDLKEHLDWHHEPFTVPDSVLSYTRSAAQRGAALHARWDQDLTTWQLRNPAAAESWRAAQSRVLPADLEESLPRFAPGSKLATRDASGQVIQSLATMLPELVGGSADLAEPNRTTIVGGGSFLPEENGYRGRNIHFGVREFAMAAITNGMMLLGGTRAFAGTFLVFSDYQRSAVRHAALMQVPSIFVWSHDSVALGQDGPTHQPIEHLASLRAMPGLTILRPADANETAAAWQVALNLQGPAGLVLCRQPLATLDLPRETVLEGTSRGAYVISDDSQPAVVLIGTGSEVHLALAAADILRAKGHRVRVVSMPSTELFLSQPSEYQDQVLPPQVRARVSVEAGSTLGWREFVGETGEIVGIDHFGFSGPAAQVEEECGLTPDSVVAAALRTLHRNQD